MASGKPNIAGCSPQQNDTPLPRSSEHETVLPILSGSGQVSVLHCAVQGGL
ncbi:UNVERIFIED_CONTAM: hypothetical protein FKN15_031904 [Acipenser sinensis]